MRAIATRPGHDIAGRVSVRRGYVWLAMLSTILLPACAITDRLEGKVDTDYAIAGQSDPETDAYLKSILDNRIDEQAKDISDDPATRLREEKYIEQTIRADLLKALYAKGYYNARVRFRDGDVPFSGSYTIRPGEKFVIADLEVVPDAYSRHLNDRFVRNGLALDAVRVLAAQGRLYNSIQKDRCYFNLDVKNEVVLNRDESKGDLDFVVIAGREGTFGPVRFEGDEGVKESYLRKLVPWKEGDCFRRETLEEYKTALMESGLFARADAVLPDAPAADGSVPITVNLRERAHRTVSAGLTYYSDEGAGVIGGWEHRNIFGAGESLKTELKLSQLKQSLDADFTKPYFLRLDQTLLLNASIRRQDTDAYQELAIDSGISISREFTEHFSANTGVALSIQKIRDNLDDSESIYGLVSLPQGLVWDTRDDKLDPHKGWNLSASGEPFFDILGESSPFFKTQFTGSGYLPLGTKADLVLASKAGIGSLWGAELENIPATERFYAGGGGSVRGFGYQEVGPQDEDGDPTGGRSLVNFSVELRGKATEKFGLVAFVDGASVTENSSPQFSEPAIGAGVGVRYYTGFGPIRFDIATPLTQKENLERNYQFYISIGQAF